MKTIRKTISIILLTLLIFNAVCITQFAAVEDSPRMITREVTEESAPDIGEPVADGDYTEADSDKPVDTDKLAIDKHEEQSLSADSSIKAELPASTGASGAVAPVKLAGEKNCNLSENDYKNYADTVCSNLFQSSDSSLNRVENFYNSVTKKKEILIENYSSDGKRLNSSKAVPFELTIFGGFYSGSKYNFVVFGDNNLDEDNNKEVVRVVRYSKAWERLGAASVYGSNTYEPFHAGSLRMTEYDGRLYIHTCHKMYIKSDGLRHQANMTFVIQEDEDSLIYKNTAVSNISDTGYVSHSFNQFIQNDGSYVYRVDHGDAYPRAISITRAPINNFSNVKYTSAISLSKTGETGNNWTGACVGGFELTDNTCVITGNIVNYENYDTAPDDTRNIFVSSTGKDLGSTSVKMLTNYTSNSNISVSNPHLVKISDNKLLVIWEEKNEDTGDYHTKYTLVDANGERISKIYSNNYYLSDCKPILCNDGIVRWYAGTLSDLFLYSLDPDNLDAYSSSEAQAVPENKEIKIREVLKVGEKYHIDYLDKYSSYWYSYTSGLLRDDEHNVYSDDTGEKQITYKFTLNRCKLTVTYDFLVLVDVVDQPNIRSLKADENGVTIKWDPVAGAYGYMVVYQISYNSWARLGDSVTGTSAIDNDISYGNTRIYSVYAVDKDDNMISDYDRTGMSITFGVETPRITSLTSDENGVNIKWNKINGVSTYRVYYKNSSGGWSSLSSDVTGTSKTDTNISYGQTKTYAVRAMTKYGKTMSNIDADGWSITYGVDTPQILSAAADENGVKIQWSKVSGANTYRVYYKNSSGVWSSLGSDVTGTSVTDTDVSYGQTKTYTVCAVNKNGAAMSDYDHNGRTVTYSVATPQITSLASDENGITIKWDKVAGASTYRVYYKNSNGDWKRFNGDITGTTKLDTGVAYNRVETYTVRAVNKKGDVISGFKKDGWSTAYRVDTPQITSLTSDENGINIKWDKVAGASTYRVYYKTSSGDWKRFNGDINGTTKLDTGVAYNRTESYTVRAVNKKGEVISGFKKDGWSTAYRVDTPQITSLTSDEKGITIKWDKVAGASTYRVYYKTSSGDWKRFSKDIKGTTKLDTGVAYNRAESYTVRAVNSKGEVISGFKKDGWSTAYRVDTPQITSLTCGDNGITIKWNKIEGVSTYRVYYKTASGDWKRFNGDIKGDTKVDTGVKVGRAETYTVRALDTKGNPISDFNRDGWSIVYEKEPKE